MNCPRCKSEMKPVSVCNIDLDMCPECEGVWFDEGELKGIIDLGEDVVRKSALAPALESDTVRVERPSLRELPCPRCNSLMMRYYYDGAPGIVIDGCQNGCGLFADDGELHKIMVHVNGEGSSLSPGDEAEMQELMKEIGEENIATGDVVTLQEPARKEMTAIERLAVMGQKPEGLDMSGRVIDFICGLFFGSRY